MGQFSSFHLDTRVNQWTQKFKTEQTLRDAECEKLKTDLLKRINDLVENTGLDEEEAFIIARKRIGRLSAWADEYKQPGY